MNKNLKAVNEETGETWDLVKPEVPKRGKKPGVAEGFTQVWIGDVFTAYRGWLTANDILTFMAVAERMDRRDGITTYNLADLNSVLRYADTTGVSKAISALIEVGLLRRRARGSVWVNPNFAWRGNAGDRSVAIWRWHNAANGSQQAGE